MGEMRPQPQPRGTQEWAPFLGSLGPGGQGAQAYKHQPSRREPPRLAPAVPGSQPHLEWQGSLRPLCCFIRPATCGLRRAALPMPDRAAQASWSGRAPRTSGVPCRCGMGEG